MSRFQEIANFWNHEFLCKGVLVYFSVTFIDIKTKLWGFLQLRLNEAFEAYSQEFSAQSANATHTG